VLVALIERVVPVQVGRGREAEIIWTPLADGMRAAIAVPVELPRQTAA
jgi:hypothetical protein